MDLSAALAFLKVDAKPSQLDRTPKFRKALVIGIAVWVFLMFLALAIVIAIDWH